LAVALEEAIGGNDELGGCGGARRAGRSDGRRRWRPAREASAEEAILVAAGAGRAARWPASQLGQRGADRGGTAVVAAGAGGGGAGRGGAAAMVTGAGGDGWGRRRRCGQFLGRENEPVRAHPCSLNTNPRRLELWPTGVN
jgi:hypothetical protein